ncbi:MAG: response regulator transcription factor, partial [Gammaproteobacteria bacterium]|nr:response regulator transcription factor [Gammaproteobacteria bacterium]
MKKEKQAKVLLVDDHAIIRKGLQLLLENKEDMVVVGEAGDGETALTLIQELSPDVVIMDISMPGLNGIETTKRVSKAFPDIKVIA